MKKLLLLCYFSFGLVVVGYNQTNSLAENDLVEKARNLQKQLNLTDAQTSKITVIFRESSQKFEKIRAAQHDITKLTAAMAPLRIETIKKIMVLLNPAQAAKFDKIVSQIDRTGGDRWTAHGSAALSNN